MRLVVGPDADRLDEVLMGPGQAYRIQPGTIHRMVAVSDCQVLEASTPHLLDVVRLEDRYGRSSDDPY